MCKENKYLENKNTTGYFTNLINEVWLLKSDMEIFYKLIINEVWTISEWRLMKLDY